MCKMVSYRNKLRARRFEDTNMKIVEHGLANVDCSGGEYTDVATPAAVKVKGKGKGKEKGKEREKSLNRVLEDIGARTGKQIRAKKLSPIDTTMLLR